MQYLARKKETYPADCQKTATVDSHKQVRDRKKKISDKDVCTNNFKVRTVLMSFRS